MSTQPISFKKFPADLYKRMKMEAVRQDKNVLDIFIQAVTKYLNGRKP